MKEEEYSHCSETIIIYLFGGLGNQLFQLSFAIGLSKKTSKKVVLSDAYLKDSLRASENTFLTSQNLVGITSSRCKLHLYPQIFSIKDIDFQNLSCCIITFPENSQWLGHISNKKVFMEIISASLNSIPTLHNDTSGILIHFRLGDYLFPPASFRYGVLKTSYHQKILSKLPANSPISLVTDDIRACRRIYKSILHGREISFSEFSSSEEDFKRMCSAEIFIAANSTMSFWAAWYRMQLSGDETIGKRTYVPYQIYRRDSIDDFLGVGNTSSIFWHPIQLMFRHPWVLGRRLKWKERLWI